MQPTGAPQKRVLPICVRSLRMQFSLGAARGEIREEAEKEIVVGWFCLLKSSNLVYRRNVGRFETL